MKFDNVRFKKEFVDGIGGFIEEQEEYVDRLRVYLIDTPIDLENVSTRMKEMGAFFYLDGVLGSDIAKDGCLRIDYQNGIIEMYK